VAGEWVLVHGAAGGVGGLLLDLARLAGVRAIGTASAGKKAEVYFNPVTGAIVQDNED